MVLAFVVDRPHGEGIEISEGDLQIAIEEKKSSSPLSIGLVGVVGLYVRTPAVSQGENWPLTRRLRIYEF